MEITLKNSLKGLLFCIVLSLPGLLSGQSITEKLGGVITKFRIKSDTSLLNEEQQLLIKRGVYNSNHSTTEGCSYGYGYGYESYHLEFTSTRKINTQKRKKKGRRKQKHYLLSLINDSGIKYLDIRIPLSHVNFIEGKQMDQMYYTYSINLKHVPLVEFDNIIELNMIKLKEY